LLADGIVGHRTIAKMVREGVQPSLFLRKNQKKLSSPLICVHIYDNI